MMSFFTVSSFITTLWACMRVDTSAFSSWVGCPLSAQPACTSCVQVASLPALIPTVTLRIIAAECYPRRHQCPAASAIPALVAISGLPSPPGAQAACLQNKFWKVPRWHFGISLPNGEWTYIGRDGLTSVGRGSRARDATGNRTARRPRSPNQVTPAPGARSGTFSVRVELHSHRVWLTHCARKSLIAEEGSDGTLKQHIPKGNGRTRPLGIPALEDVG